MCAHKAYTLARGVQCLRFAERSGSDEADGKTMNFFIIPNSRGAQGLSSGPVLTGQLAIIRGLEGGTSVLTMGMTGGHVEFKGDDPHCCCCRHFFQEFIPTTKDQCFCTCRVLTEIVPSLSPKTLIMGKDKHPLGW